jgi:hypothetical protein
LLCDILGLPDQTNPLARIAFRRILTRTLAAAIDESTTPLSGNTKGSENNYEHEGKNDCVDSIARVAERTAAWRKGISANFNDPRNLTSTNNFGLLLVITLLHAVLLPLLYVLARKNAL